MLSCFLYALICFLASITLGHFGIPVLKSKKLGQKILEDGPRWHAGKEGTPTMGGLFFILPTLVAVPIYAAFSDETPVGLLLTLGLGVSMGLVGVVDDLTKFRKKQNAGLTPVQKLVFQFLAAALYLFGMAATGEIDTVVSFFCFPVSFDLGFAYYVLLLIFIVGIDNSVNLTDGIDGLCGSVSVAVCAFFVSLGFLLNLPDLSILAACVVGGLFGFLAYNLHPAKVFMGDTGSLFLGGIVVGLSILADYEVLIVLVGLVYLIEEASVILQVAYYKLSHGKRLFLMAPIHHHFEKRGWSENKIVLVALVSTTVFGAIAILAFRFFC
ncbi:MAG: phospho-N-acetylmuramoyl-pentapeptide-transferase [Ruminococcus sp.]|nr:phospho-N-acetylmuramoyl-pentapeptide-transferase [Candidatus Apopatosoma intestinale]